MIGIAKAAVALLITIGYSLVTHRISIANDNSLLSYGVVFIFPAIMIVGVILKPTRASWSLLAIAVVFIAAWLWSGQPAPSTATVLLLQHAGVHAALGCVFGATLLPGIEPLISRMARAFRGQLDDNVARYTRRVTWVWTLYFFVMATISVSLYAAGETTLWSILANFLTLPIIIIIFMTEMFVRRRTLPNMPHATIRETLQAMEQVRGQQTVSEPKN